MLFSKYIMNVHQKCGTKLLCVVMTSVTRQEERANLEQNHFRRNTVEELSDFPTCLSKHKCDPR